MSLTTDQEWVPAAAVTITRLWITQKDPVPFRKIVFIINPKIAVKIVPRQVVIVTAHPERIVPIPVPVSIKMRHVMIYSGPLEITGIFISGMTPVAAVQ